jgi:predicted NAD/FAD-binding protein
MGKQSNFWYVTDRIIFCVHAPDALKVLGTEATPDEQKVLEAFQYIYRYF